MSKNPDPQSVNLNTDGQIDSTGTARVHQSCASFSYDFIRQKSVNRGSPVGGWSFNFEDRARWRCSDRSKQGTPTRMAGNGAEPVVNWVEREARRGSAAIRLAVS